MTDRDKVISILQDSVEFFFNIIILQDINHFKFIKEEHKTFKLCLNAYILDRSYLKYIPDKFKTIDFYKQAYDETRNIEYLHPSIANEYISDIENYVITNESLDIYNDFDLTVDNWINILKSNNFNEDLIDCIPTHFMKEDLIIIILDGTVYKYKFIKMQILSTIFDNFIDTRFLCKEISERNYISDTELYKLITKNTDINNYNYSLELIECYRPFIYCIPYRHQIKLFYSYLFS